MIEYVTWPAKIGHICTRNLTLFLNFSLQYLSNYKCYYNEIFIPYSQINNKKKFTEREYNKHRPRKVLFSEHVYFVHISLVFAGPVTYNVTSTNDCLNNNFCLVTIFVIPALTILCRVPMMYPYTV